MKVIPEIVTAVVYRLAAANLQNMYNETAEAVYRKDFSRLPELHALACILKVATSYDSTYGIERLRQAAGNLGNIFAMAAPSCTYEGENSVLYLQVGKILMKNWSQVLAGRELMPSMAYISECSKMTSFPQWTGSWECLLKAIQYACVSCEV